MKANEGEDLEKNKKKLLDEEEKRKETQLMSIYRVWMGMLDVACGWRYEVVSIYVHTVRGK